MTKQARKEAVKERRTQSGERESVKAIPVAAPIELDEDRRRPRTVNRPARATDEGYVTLGFRGTEEDDEVVRRAVELGGFYSKADMIRRATMELAEKTIKEKGASFDVRRAAAALGVSKEDIEALVALAKKRKK